MEFEHQQGFGKSGVAQRSQGDAMLYFVRARKIVCTWSRIRLAEKCFLASVFVSYMGSHWCVVCVRVCVFIFIAKDPRFVPHNLRLQRSADGEFGCGLIEVRLSCDSWRLWSRFREGF